MTKRISAVLIDANLLLLLGVGGFDKSFVGRGRLDIFTADDFDLLNAHIGRFQRFMTTPHVLAELSNLSDQVIPRRQHRIFRQFLAAFVHRLEEQWTTAINLCATDQYIHLGLTDAAICHLADSAISVYTIDAALYVTLLSRGVDVTNFHHLRI